MQLVRAAYLGMEVVATSVIVPLAFAAFVTGIVQAFGTKWGLFRHFWVQAKLGLTVAASVVVVMQLKHIRSIADAAQARPLSPGDLSWPRTDLVLHAASGLAVLLVISALAVYRPRGIVRSWTGR